MMRAVPLRHCRVSSRAGNEPGPSRLHGMSVRDSSRAAGDGRARETGTQLGARRASAFVVWLDDLVVLDEAIGAGHRQHLVLGGATVGELRRGRADALLDVGQDIQVVVEELLGVLAALPEALVLQVEPGAALADD